MKKEYDFSKAKRANFFRRMPPLEELDRHTKVRITIMLDLDTLKFFKAKAAVPGADPYQTQINKALREYIAGGRPATPDALAADDAFISRLAERVASYAVTKAKRPGRRPRTASK